MANTIEVNKDMILYIETRIDSLEINLENGFYKLSEIRAMRSEMYHLKRALELGKIK